MFEPEPESGDRWRWGVVLVLGFAGWVVLDSRALWPATRLVFVAFGVVIVAAGIATLVRLLR